MCIACSSGVPVCAVSGACSVSLQHAVAASAVVGTGLFAVIQTWLGIKAASFKNYFVSKRHNKL